MKIGIVCYPTYGGSGVVATELGKGLAALGHEVHFISYRQPARLDSRAGAPLPPMENSHVSDTSVDEKVTKIVCDQMGTTPDKISLETSFINDLGADSLDTVELVMEFEDAFDINIPDEDAEKIQTVGAAVEYIGAKLQ